MTKLRYVNVFILCDTFWWIESAITPTKRQIQMRIIDLYLRDIGISSCSVRKVFLPFRFKRSWRQSFLVFSTKGSHVRSVCWLIGMVKPSVIETDVRISATTIYSILWGSSQSHSRLCLTIISSKATFLINRHIF